MTSDMMLWAETVFPGPLLVKSYRNSTIEGLIWEGWKTRFVFTPQILVSISSDYTEHVNIFLFSLLKLSLNCKIFVAYCFQNTGLCAAITSFTQNFNRIDLRKNCLSQIHIGLMFEFLDKNKVLMNFFEAREILILCVVLKVLNKIKNVQLFFRNEFFIWSIDFSWKK